MIEVAQQILALQSTATQGLSIASNKTPIVHNLCFFAVGVVFGFFRSGVAVVVVVVGVGMATRGVAAVAVVVAVVAVVVVVMSFAFFARGEAV